MQEIIPLRVRKIYSDGRHNAFTSLTGFKDKLFLTFRSAATHLSFDGQIRVLRSSDRGESWETAALISLENCDLRDPKLIEFNGVLHLFCFGRYEDGRNASWHITSSDGKTFSSPAKIEGIPLIWGLSKFGGKLYCTAYKAVSEMNHVPSLYSSPDGDHWDLLLKFPTFGSEVAIDFDRDGSLHAFIRDSSFGCGHIPTVCRLEPPYNAMPELHWETMDLVRALPLRMSGPMIKRFNGASLLVGRCWDGSSFHRRNLRTEVYLLEDDDEPRHCFVLPSGGDTSYASYHELRPGRALMSYYSSHEHKMALPLDQEYDNAAVVERTAGSDIFLADISHNFWKNN